MRWLTIALCWRLARHERDSILGDDDVQEQLDERSATGGQLIPSALLLGQVVLPEKPKPPGSHVVPQSQEGVVQCVEALAFAGQESRHPAFETGPMGWGSLHASQLLQAAIIREDCSQPHKDPVGRRRQP